MPELTRNIALVIGINSYRNGIFPLQNAVNDAKKLAKILREQYQYQVWVCLDEMATLTVLKQQISEILPLKVNSNDKLLFYFAGHGLALNSNENPQGYLIPQDAVLGDANTYLSMTQVHECLSQLPCRQFLAILDCYFAQAFPKSRNSDALLTRQGIYQKRYELLISNAWQRMASVASDQETANHVATNSELNQIAQPSSFATLLCKSLQSGANLYSMATNGTARNGDMSAAELHLNLREHIEAVIFNNSSKQLSSSWSLKKHDKGEYIFPIHKHSSNLSSTSLLNESQNPPHQAISQTENAEVAQVQQSDTQQADSQSQHQTKNNQNLWLWIIAIAVSTGLSVLTIFAVVNQQEAQKTQISASEQSSKSDSSPNSAVEQKPKTQSQPKTSSSPTPAPITTEDFYTRVSDKAEIAKQARFIKLYSQIIRKNPNNVDAYINRGIAYYRQGQYKQAISDFDQAIKRDVKNVHAYINRAIAYHRLGQHERTIADCNLVIKTNPKFVDAYITRGIAYRWLGKYEESIADFNQAISISPQNADAYYALGLIKAQLQDKQVAIKNYRKAAQLYQQQGKTDYFQSTLNRIKEQQNTKPKRKT